MLGQPISMLIPQVRRLPADRTDCPKGATATDLVLTITERLRKHGVVGKFVEFFGPGLEFLTIADRATLGNMSPGVRRDDRDLPDRRDDARLPAPDRPRRRRTSRWSRRTRRSRGCSAPPTAPDPVYTETLELDLVDRRAEPRRAEAAAGSRLAAPGEGQVPAGARGRCWPSASRRRRRREAGRDERAGGATAAAAVAPRRKWPPGMEELDHGAVVIAAITSCTNTSNPSVMIGAGLLAQEGRRARAERASRG